VAIWFITVKPGKTTTLPAARSGDAANRSLYIVESGQAITVSGRSVPPKSYVSLRAGSDFELVNTSPDTDLEVLMLQGRPISEPVAQHGPFVMNTRAEIMQVCFFSAFTLFCYSQSLFFISSLFRHLRITSAPALAVGRGRRTP
jgi:redox-sensitive bicupin YhaK (pirin superfamily)